MKRVISRSFAIAVAKKSKMQLTIRTPYKTIVENLADFKRVITKTNEGVLNIQDKTPAAVHVLPPGLLRVKLEKDVSDFSGDLLHTGGFVVINADNSCQIHLTEAVDKKNVNLAEIGKNNLEPTEGGISGKYVDKIRQATAKSFNKLQK